MMTSNQTANKQKLKTAKPQNKLNQKKDKNEYNKQARKTNNRIQNNKKG